MTILCYAYDADTHCIGCTVAKSEAGRFKLATWMPENESGPDGNGVPYASLYSEGNTLGVMFRWDEGQLNEDGEELPVICGTCGGTIRD